MRRSAEGEKNVSSPLKVVRCKTRAARSHWEPLCLCVPARDGLRKLAQGAYRGLDALEVGYNARLWAGTKNYASGSRVN